MPRCENYGHFDTLTVNVKTKHGNIEGIIKSLETIVKDSQKLEKEFDFEGLVTPDQIFFNSLKGE